jgi:hypothetical protein
VTCPAAWLPPGYLDPLAADSAAFRVKGTMVAPNQPSDYVPAEFAVVVGGQTIDIGGYAVWIEASNTEISVNAAGRMKDLGPGHGTYTYFYAAAPRADLLAAKQAGEPLVAAGAGSLWVANVELKSSGADTLYEMCPLAATDPVAAGSSFFVCSEGNTDFAPGEVLQLAGSQALSTDPAVIQAAVGIAAPCTCWKNAGTPLACSAFDAA